MVDSVSDVGASSSSFRWRVAGRRTVSGVTTRGFLRGVALQSDVVTPPKNAQPIGRSSVEAETRSRVIYSTDAAATLRIEGEVFLVELDDGLVFLRHPRWSLVGYGETLQEAERNLREEAESVAPVWYAASPSTLDDEAQRLRQYLVRLVGRR